MQSGVFNGGGWASTIIAIWLNLFSWLESINFNQAITIVISLLSAVFLCMKIYDQYLITKARRKISNG